MLGTVGFLVLSASPGRADPFAYQIPDHVISQGLDPHYFTGLVLTEHPIDQGQFYFDAATKLIGPPQQDLASLFQADGSANAILFFDEADPLFTHRTDVKDAHDRYGQDFIVLDGPAGRWRGQLFVGGIDHVDDGVYSLSGTFRDSNGSLNLQALPVPEPGSASLIAPLCLFFGASIVIRRRPVLAFRAAKPDDGN